MKLWLLSFVLSSLLERIFMHYLHPELKPPCIESMRSSLIDSVPTPYSLRLLPALDRDLRYPSLYLYLDDPGFLSSFLSRSASGPFCYKVADLSSLSFLEDILWNYPLDIRYSSCYGDVAFKTYVLGGLSSHSSFEYPQMDFLKERPLPSQVYISSEPFSEDFKAYPSEWDASGLMTLSRRVEILHDGSSPYSSLTCWPTVSFWVLFVFREL